MLRGMSLPRQGRIVSDRVYSVPTSAGMFANSAAGIFEKYTVGMFEKCAVGIFEKYTVGMYEKCAVGMFEK